MEVQEYIFSNWITLANLLLIIGVIIKQAKWQEKVDMKLLEFQEHKSNQELHMPLKEAIVTFVPRIELDGRLLRIEALLDKIDSKIKPENKN